MKKIPLSSPWIDQLELERVRAALSSQLSGDGPFGRQVERRLAELLGARRVLLTTSCTHAMELALLALGIGEGAEVICPSFTFVSTANAVLRVGARPVFADIEETTLGLDPRDVERVLSPATVALLPVHYGGLACDMDGLLGLARQRGLRVVEDAAHALGARLSGRPLGTLGDAGCFSFHETKNITCGEGGALALQDEALIRNAEIMREKGTNRAAFLRGEIDRYTWVAEGSSYVLSDVLAAVLDAQLDKLDEIQARRSRISSAYRDGLADWAEAHQVRLPPTLPDRQSSHHTFHLLFDSEADRDRCMDRLRGAGILATFHYVPLHESSMGQRVGGASGSGLPVTERVARCLLRLPLYAQMQEGDAERVVAAVRSSLP
jgi:dTDP-4-amino-4,6-dideoxygalactose transaminase